MSDQDKGLEEKTEEASQYRRDEWRKEGRVFQSKELTGAVLLFSMTVVLYLSSSYIFGGMSWVFQDILGDLPRVIAEDWSAEKVVSVGSYAYTAFAKILFPIAATAILVGILGTLAQTGVVWSTKPLEINLEKLNPMKGISRIFGVEGFFELIKATAKFAIMGGVVFSLLKGWIGEAAGFWSLDPAQFGSVFAPYILKILLAVALSMMVLALFDYGFQRFRYEQEIKMTKQEAREERKQTEGDPKIKARVRQIQRQVAFQRMMEAVKTADVIVTNPTHIAVALKYDRDSMVAPKVVAKGADHIAQKIKAVAREAGIPCVENVKLARAMYKAIKIGQFVSRDLFNAVAEVLAYVYRLRGNFR